MGCKCTVYLGKEWCGISCHLALQSKTQLVEHSHIQMLLLDRSNTAVIHNSLRRGFPWERLLVWLCRDLPRKSSSDTTRKLIYISIGFPSVLRDLHSTKGEVHCQENPSNHFGCQSAAKKGERRREEPHFQPITLKCESNSGWMWEVLEEVSWTESR